MDSSTGGNAAARVQTVNMSAVGAALVGIGNGSANSTEKISGSLRITSGAGTVTAIAGAGYNEQITAGGMAHTAGQMLFRGDEPGGEYDCFHHRQ